MNIEPARPAPSRAFQRIASKALLLLAVSLLSVPGLAQEDPRLSLAQANKQEQDILGEIERMDRQLQALTDEITALQAQMDQVEARRIQAEDELSATQVQLDMESRQVSRRCAALYVLVRRGLARVLFGAESYSDLRRRMRYLVAILEQDRTRLTHFTELVERRASALQSIDTDRATVGLLQADLRLKESELRDGRARKLALLDQIRNQKDLAMRAMAQQARAGMQMARTTQSSSQQAMASDRAMLSSEFRAAYGQLPWPVSGNIIKGFGSYKDPATGQKLRNHGLDLEAPYGTPFRAVFDGVVVKAGYIPGYGQCIVLGHGAYSTVYAHANGLRVSMGQAVHGGDILGFVGNSGLVDTSAYQLHFEIRYNATPQNPLDWLSHRSASRP